MKRRGFLVLALALTFTTTTTRAARAAGQRYGTRGVVRYIAKDRTRVRIRHEDIPGFMKAMTMPFDADPKLLAGVTEGDHVSFTFEARDDGSNVILALARVVGRGSTHTKSTLENENGPGRSRCTRTQGVRSGAHRTPLRCADEQA